MKPGVIKSCIVFLLPLLCCLTLSGCWDRHEINDLAVVLATGIDYSNKKVQLTAQIFIPRKSGGTSSSGSTESSPSGVTMIRTAEGVTIAEALNRLQRKISREMFWGHCEVVVISEQAGKQGLREYIDFLLRYPQFREHAYVFSSKGDAKEILTLLDPLERSSAESLREMANLGLGTRVTMLELAQSISGPSSSAILSRLLISPADPGQKKLATTPFIKGLSLYSNGDYITTVTEPVSIGVLLLSNELNNIIMPIEIENVKGSFSIRPEDTKTILTPRIANGEWSMDIHIQSKGEIVLNTTDSDLANPIVLAKVEEAWLNRFKQLAGQALQLAQQEMSADLFKFAVKFRRYDPKQWKQHQRNWENIYRNMKVHISGKVVITDTGKSIEPQGIPHQITE
ncbi:Ger(x)C family spore germination protein [Paenibacillus sp. CAU 1782]